MYPIRTFGNRRYASTDRCWLWLFCLCAYTLSIINIHDEANGLLSSELFIALLDVQKNRVIYRGEATLPSPVTARWPI